MEKKQTTAVLALMRMSYPRFYPATQSPEDVGQTIDLWHDFFKNDDFEVVKLALSTLIQRLEYPPTIADVRKEINKLTETVSDEPTAMEEWNAIRTAIRNSGYHSVELFERLPEKAKKFVGSPAQLRAWGMSTDFNDGVIRGQFLKQYEVLKERERYSTMLSDSMKEHLRELVDRKGLKVLEGGKDV